MLPRLAPELSLETYWFYKSAYVINQTWSIKAAGVRSRHIDQAQSMNLYITDKFTMRGVLDLYIKAWENDVKWNSVTLRVILRRIAAKYRKTCRTKVGQNYEKMLHTLLQIVEKHGKISNVSRA